jgi:hypothetical protein
VPPGAVAWLCLWPHDRQIAPTALMSVSFEISFSRTAVEPEITGPPHLSHEYAETCKYCLLIGVLSDATT